MGTQFSQPTVRGRWDDQSVTLDRPPRPPAGAVNDLVRGAILRRAHEDLGLNAVAVLALHTEADHLADTSDLLLDIEQRYNLNLGAMISAVVLRLPEVRSGLPLKEGANPLAMVFQDRGAGHVLLALPDTEFLTAIEHAVDLGNDKGAYGNSDFSGITDAGNLARTFFAYADAALAAHGAPFRRVADTLRFEWVGDPAQREITIQPALLVLADSRLAGARAEFDEALHKRRGGTPKDLESALDEAAKAVESVLKVLHEELDVAPPRSQQVTPLFNSLVAANKIPGYVDKLITAASGPRNHMASHGQGATVRDVPEELADASIAAAATAITFLAHYLP